MKKTFLLRNRSTMPQLQKAIDKFNNALIKDKRFHYYLGSFSKAHIEHFALPVLMASTADIKFILDPDDISDPVKVELLGDIKLKWQKIPELYIDDEDQC